MSQAGRKNGIWYFLVPRVLSLLFFRARIGPEAVDRIRKRVKRIREGKWNEVGERVQEEQNDKSRHRGQSPREHC